MRPTAYNATLARALMAINTAALCPPATLHAWRCSRCAATACFPGGRGLEVVTAEPEPAGDGAATMALLALVGTCPALELTVVAVRGTVDAVLEDWLIDAEAWQKPFEPSAAYAGSLVHAGFARSWERLRPGVGAALARARLRAPRYAVALTGHSLGAGIAALASAEWLSAARPPPLLYYTMGEPRVGNAAFAAAHQRAVAAAGGAAHRVVNRRDVVPHLPPRSLLNLSYHHLPTELWLAPNGTAVGCDGTGEDPRCSDSVPPREWSAADHISYYGLDAGACASAVEEGV